MTSSTAPTPALHPATLAAHGGSSVADPYRDLAPPLHLSTTFERAADGSYPGGRVYSRDQSPAYDGVEQLLARQDAGFRVRCGLDDDHETHVGLLVVEWAFIDDDEGERRVSTSLAGIFLGQLS